MPNLPDETGKFTWEKWVIGALSTLTAIFFALYVGAVDAQMKRLDDDVKVQTQRQLSHEQRLTTLEESSRNTKDLLERMHKDLEEIKRAVVR